MIEKSQLVSFRAQALMFPILILGPYWFGGLRIEHFVVYGFLLVAILTRHNRLLVWAPSDLLIATLLLFPLIIGLVNTFWLYGAVPGDISEFVSAMDNYFLPVAAFFLAICWTTASDRSVILRNLCLGTLFAGSLNAVVAFAQSVQPDLLRPFLRLFWGETPVGSFVAENAEGNLRFSGLINQPAESGLMYGICLLAAIYLLRLKRPSKWLVFTAMALIVFGGLLTGSKVFLVAIILAVVTFLLSVTSFMKRIISAMFLLAAGVILWIATLGQFRQLRYYLTDSIWQPSEWFSGRYFTNGSTEPFMAFVREQGLLGSDLLLTGTTSDSEWVRLLGASGLAGVLAFVTVFVLLFRRVLSPRSDLVAPERALAGSILVLGLGATFGIPAFSANKSGSLLVVFFGVLLVRSVSDRPPRLLENRSTSWGVGGLLQSQPVRLRAVRIETRSKEYSTRYFSGVADLNGRREAGTARLSRSATIMNDCPHTK